MPYFWMLASSLSFAGMGALAHGAGNTASWPIVAFSRSFLVLVFMAFYAWRSSTKLIFPGPRLLWVRSLAGTASLLSTFFALTHMPVSSAITLTNTFPLWVAVLSWPMLGRVPHRTTWLAMLMALAGVALIEQPGPEGFSPAAVIALLAALATSIAMLGLNRLGKIDPRAIVVHFAGVSLPFCVIAAGFYGFENLNYIANSETIFSLLGVGTLATIGQYCLTLAFARGDASKVSIIGLSQVIFALAIDWLCFRATLNWEIVLGVLLILTSSAWVMGNSRRARVPNSEPITETIPSVP